MSNARKKTTPPVLARRWGVNVGKVTDFIREGELPAINLASSSASRPRYFIDEDDIAAFERSRRVVPDVGNTAIPRLRRGAAGNVKEFV